MTPVCVVAPTTNVAYACAGTTPNANGNGEGLALGLAFGSRGDVAPADGAGTGSEGGVAPTVGAGAGVGGGVDPIEGAGAADGGSVAAACGRALAAAGAGVGAAALCAARDAVPSKTPRSANDVRRIMDEENSAPRCSPPAVASGASGQKARLTAPASPPAGPSAARSPSASRATA
ncbi:MAG: hypothetical protein NVS3B7_03720 [Candidatus Elarobacter sp.]